MTVALAGTPERANKEEHGHEPTGPIGAVL
jgi:hypothetical protein